MDIKILVATHKKYWMPEDDVYFPLHVGAEGKDALGYMPDNTGDNISYKNASYCELTGVYWAWKNLSADYVGLCHYRRYFSRSIAQNEDGEGKKKQIFSEEDYKKILDEYDVILPQSLLFGRHFTVYAQYASKHYIKDLYVLQQVIGKMYPEYGSAFDAIMKKHSLFCYNMFVMEKVNFDKYCQWLFSILFEVEKRINVLEYDSYQKRVFGFLAERLLNVWLLKQKLRSKEVPVVYLEKQERMSAQNQLRLCLNRIFYKALGW